MLSNIKTAVCIGIEGRCVDAEANTSSGLPYFNIVGLAATTVMESRDRIKHAIINSGFEYPRGRITVNLAPAGIRKNGSQLDLPVAIGILECEGYVDYRRSAQYGIIGELSLSGEVMRVGGVLPMLLAMSEAGIKRAIVPRENYREALLATNIRAIPVSSISECVEIINEVRSAAATDETDRSVAEGVATELAEAEKYDADFADIRGQESAKRAITIAAAGRHGMLMIGSPGCGKTMLARRIPTIMPPMSERERLECTVIYSVMGKIDPALGAVTGRPFRMPYQTITMAGMFGGGSYPMPGEISLAHNGVLFLDEVCEFSRDVLEALRLPIEDREIVHARRGQYYRFPCSCLLVMAANPCRCGYFGDAEHECSCTPHQIDSYRKRLSGPLRQRIDININMERVGFDSISGSGKEPMGSAKMREAILRAGEFARSRGRNKPSGELNDAEVDRYCRCDRSAQELLCSAYDSLGLTPRTYKKTLKVARTIADLDCSEEIRIEHVSEALSYREEERNELQGQ